MRQLSNISNVKNPVYGIIGKGRVGSHFSYYFSLMGIPHKVWCRKSEENLSYVFSSCDIILLAVNDDSIIPLINNNPILTTKKICIHFSSTINSKNTFSFHPLMSFGKKLYELSLYKSICFVTKEKSFSFKNFFPKLPNKSIRMDKSETPYYHALCVIANNFTTLIWQKFFNEMKKYNISKESIMPFFSQTFENIKSHLNDSLTGPLSRKDHQTIALNIEALRAKNDSFLKIYESFVSTHTNEKMDV